MTPLRDASIRTKLSRGFGIALGLVIVIGLIGIAQLQAQNTFATDLARVTIPKLRLLGEIKGAMAEHRLLATRRIETTNFHQLAEIADAIDAVSDKLRADMTAYAGIAESAEEREHYAVFVEDWTTYQESFASVLRRLEIGEITEGLEQFETESLVALDMAVGHVEELLAISKREGIEAADQAQAIYLVFLSLTAVTVLAASLAMVGGILWVGRNVSQPILRVSDAMSRLTAGDQSVVIAGDSDRKDEIGTLIAAVASYRESLIEQHRLAEEAEVERQRLNAAISNMPIGLSMFDADKRLIVANARYGEMYGLPDELMQPGTPLEDMLDYRISIGHFDGGDPVKFRKDILAIADRRKTNKDVRQFPDGRIFSVIVQPMRGGGWVSTHEDVTAQHEAEQKIIRLGEQAELERQRLDAAISNMPIGLCLFGADKRLITANARYAEMYGLPSHFMEPGTPLKAILEHRISVGDYPGDDPSRYSAELLAITDRRVPWRDIRQYNDGRIFSVIHQPLEGGGWVATHEDVTDQRKAAAQIAHMAHHDALTDLPNRILFRERIQEALARETSKNAVAVLYLDLDHFKEVNDTLGHALGDKILIAAGERLAGCVREDDAIARLGGDEFAVVQVGTGQPKGSSRLAQRVIDELSAPFAVDGHQVVIGASVGIAIAPVDGDDADRLLKNSDMALYRAKADGRGVFRYFEPEMDARMQARRALEMDLRKAVALNEFELHYQPQVRLETNEITGFEALLRWHHPDRGFVPPTKFIPLAEETGLIVPIGEWVLKQACADAMHWPANVRVAVNLSAVQFRNARLMKAVVAALAASGLPASRLELEVTESVLLADTDVTLAMLHQLKELGAHISMDDFGTGYSSLSYLQSFPFDKIKIDRRFIVDVTTVGSSLAIVRAVTGLSQSLGIDTTAEGVETSEQLDRLKAEGCTEVQGYLVGRPMPLANARALFKRPRGKSVVAA